MLEIYSVEPDPIVANLLERKINKCIFIFNNLYILVKIPMIFCENIVSTVEIRDS